MRAPILLFSFLAAAIALPAADPPYAGTWKTNIAKSEMAGTTITFQKLAGDEWQATADGVTYKFKMDGREYPDNLGDMAAWKNVDANTWQTAWTTNGKTVSTDTLRVGADGIMTVSTKGTKPNGEAIDDATTFQRVSGGPGLAGKWRSKSTKSSSPEVIELDAGAGNALTYKVPSFGMSCEGKLDGKDYPCTGPTLAAGWAVALNKTGTNSFTAIVKKDSKPLYRYTYTASPDGKMLTTTGGAVATKEKIKIVYDRQ